MSLVAWLKLYKIRLNCEKSDLPPVYAFNTSCKNNMISFLVTIRNY